MHAKWAVVVVVIVIVEVVLCCVVLLCFVFLSNWWRLYTWHGIRQSQLIDSSLAYVVRFKSRKFVYNFVYIFVWCCCNHCRRRRRRRCRCRCHYRHYCRHIHRHLLLFRLFIWRWRLARRKFRHCGEKQQQKRRRQQNKVCLLTSLFCLCSLPRNFIVRRASKSSFCGKSKNDISKKTEKRKKKMIPCTIHSFTFIYYRNLGERVLICVWYICERMCVRPRIRTSTWLFAHI